MYDPRWNDPREGDNGRARAYDERDRVDHDPRDGLMRDLDLPRGQARELVVDRDYIRASMARVRPFYRARRACGCSHR